MKTKIKTKFLSVLLTTSLLIIAIVSTVHYFFEKELADKYTEQSIKSINYLLKKNNELSSDTLTPFTERYLELAVDEISDEILNIKHKYSKLDKSLLQNNSLLRKIITKYSYIKTSHVVRFEVLDKDEIVLSFDPSEENKEYSQWFKRCPEMKKYVDFDHNYKGYYSLKIDNVETPVYMNILHVPNTEYDVIAFLNLEKYLEPVNLQKKEKLRTELMHLESSATTFLNETIFNIGVVTATVILIILLICIPISVYLASTLTKPIRKLSDEVKKIGKGNFDIHISEQGSFEVVELIRSFNYLGKELQDYIKNLEIEISARQKVENEVKIAAKIQKSTLPEVTSEFNTECFTVSAMLDPAKEASGDFYDFFFLPNGKLALVIADVSGKGLPAAFFMALSKTVIRHICELEQDDPTAALSKTNDFLAISNREYMFVTVFLMYFDTETGKAEYANAGHHNAIILKNDNTLEHFGKFNDSVIGFGTNLTFRKGEISIDKNETVLFYTDGITDAFSPNKEQFGEKRLEEILNSNKDTDINTLSKTIVQRVREFEDNSRFDDATVLLFKRK